MGNKNTEIIAEIKDILPKKDEFLFQDYLVEIESGEFKGREVEVYSDGLNYREGQRVYVSHIKESGGGEYFILGEALRQNEILGTLILFIGVIVAVFGRKGIKSLFSLALSLVAIFFILIPAALKGYNPIMISGIFSILLLSLLMLITHGRNKITYSALIGSVSSVLITIIITYITITKASITGFVDDIDSGLFFATNGQIDFTLLTIAGVIIGVIGVVDDASITQASAVRELKSLDNSLSDLEYWKRAMRIGEDHAGAMINTLVMAYVSASLPVLLLFYNSTNSLSYLINKEIIATEIFRSLIGSIGILLSIPITTWIAVKLIKEKDLHSSGNASHTHAHVHGHSHIH